MKPGEQGETEDRAHGPDYRPGPGAELGRGGETQYENIAIRPGQSA